jgi:hypothetical protein
MNRRLTEIQIRATCRELITQEGPISGRRLRAELRSRFGAAGKTQRVFRVWREMTQRMAEGAGTTDDLKGQVATAEQAAARNLERAELAEYREQAHQERWAAEIDQLRQQLNAHQGRAAEMRRLEERVLQLSRELMAAREELAREQGNSGPPSS